MTEIGVFNPTLNGENRPTLTWETMKERDISTYTLIHKYGINPRTINNLKHNKSITMFTLEKLCEILNCEPNDIIKFEKG